MTSPINGMVTDYVGKTTAAASTGSAEKKNPTPGGELDKDAFLKLLVAQLKYQDPSKPADSSQFLAQTAQFTTVEKLASMATSQQDLLTAQLRLGASNLIGKTVSYLNAEGESVSGVVSSATFSGSTPTLRVGDTDVALSSVTEVRHSNGATGATT